MRRAQIMRLKDYLKKKKIGVTAFASKAGLKQPHLSLIANGKRRPSPDIALKIEQATGGIVTIRELLYPEK
jgi:DNA-binding transcriptional regulator YdaS (Cro superfamily)